VTGPGAGTGVASGTGKGVTFGTGVEIRQEQEQRCLRA
jgi:hypothetical protein